MNYDSIDADGIVRSSNTITSAVRKPIAQQRDKSKEGDCYIFDYQNFTDGAPRYGSENDVIRLRNDFENLGFNVFSDHLNLTKNQTLEVLKEAAKQDYTQTKYFVCCFLTHGNDGILKMRDKKPLKIYEILDCFSRSACKTLSGKPKIFIFQACRGKEGEEQAPFDGTDSVSVSLVDGTDSESAAPVDRTGSKSVTSVNGTGSESVTDIPDYLDYLLIYATFKGRVAFKTLNLDYREGNHGSFFIDELCRTLEDFSDKLDLLQMLTIANYRVARLFQSRSINPKLNKKKQMPCFTSRLTSNVMFDKKILVQKTSHTEHFDKRRNESPLGEESTKNPLEDKKEYKILKPNRIKFLLLVNLENNFEKELLDSTSSLWSSITKRGYQTETLTNWSEEKLTNFLKEAPHFSNTDCSICFIACKADGDYLCDVNGKKFLKQHVIENFTGRMCPVLVGKPKIFIFLMSSQTNVDQESPAAADGTDGDNHNTFPLHSDLLEVAITFQKSKQLKGVVEMLCEIFGSESSEHLLNQLTNMYNELVEGYGFYSPLNKNLATFYLDSTLTETLILNKPQSNNS